MLLRGENRFDYRMTLGGQPQVSLRQKIYKTPFWALILSVCHDYSIRVSWPPRQRNHGRD